MSDYKLLFPYKAYLSTLLTKSEEYKKTVLSSIAYYPDTTPDKFDANNKGYTTRKGICANSVTFELMGRPCTSLFEIRKWIVPGVSIDITFTKNQPAFCLDTPTSNASYIFSIEEYYLLLKTYRQIVILRLAALAR